MKSEERLGRRRNGWSFEKSRVQNWKTIAGYKMKWREIVEAMGQQDLYGYLLFTEAGIINTYFFFDFLIPRSFPHWMYNLPNYKLYLPIFPVLVCTSLFYSVYSSSINPTKCCEFFFTRVFVFLHIYFHIYSSHFLSIYSINLTKQT